MGDLYLIFIFRRWCGATRSLVHGEQHMATGRRCPLEEVPQVREPTPSVLEVAIRQLPVALGVDGVVPPAQFVSVDVLDGRRCLPNLLRAEVAHEVVLALVQVVTAEDTVVECGVTPLQLTVGQAAVDGVPRLIRLLRPLGVPALTVRPLL